MAGNITETKAGSGDRVTEGKVSAAVDTADLSLGQETTPVVPDTLQTEVGFLGLCEQQAQGLVAFCQRS